jgi:roadblock/LC7 domain-containing protein
MDARLAEWVGWSDTTTTQFDAAVAANSGMVGKHAGDGWTAFYLDGDGLVYQPLAAYASAGEKALHDAGTIAVCRL